MSLGDGVVRFASETLTSLEVMTLFTWNLSGVGFSYLATPI